MPGDVVDIEVWVKYIDDDPQNWTPLLNNLIAAISIPSGGIFIDGGQPGSLGNETLPFIPLDNDSEPGVAPKAYLNYIIMDRDFNKIVNAGAKPVTTAAREYGQNGEHERLFFDDIVVREAGYMYIYLSNEGDELVDVFFDDLKVTHTKSPIVEAQDYYPFGLTFNSYHRENSVSQDYLYNGKEIQNELDLGWYDYKFRMYVPDIARFFVNDPLAEMYGAQTPYAYAANNPILFVDKDGMGPDDPNPDPPYYVTANNGRVNVQRVSTDGRVTLQIGLAIAKVNPIVSWVSVGVEGYQYFSTLDVNQGLTFAKDAGTQGALTTYDKVTEWGSIDPQANQKLLKKANKYGKVAGRAFSFLDIAYAISNTNPTTMESLSQLSFNTANDLGITTGIPGREDELIQFDNKSTTKEQAENIMGSIYGVLDNVLQNFDLTNKDDVKAARKFIRKNLGIVGRAVQIQMTGNKKEDDENENRQ